jgi:hypothetical protein
MDQEYKELLQNTYKLTEENNLLLHKVRNAQNRQTYWQILKYVIIIGIAFGSFYFLEPYLNKMMDLYNTVSGAEQKINDFSVQDLLKKF